MTSRHPVPMVLLLAVMAGARLAAAEAEGELERFLVEVLHAPSNAGVSVALPALGGTVAKIMAASDAGIEVRVGDGGNLALPWTRISEADLFVSCHPFIAKAGAKAQARFLAAAIHLGHGQERDIQDLLAALRTVDAERAHELDAELESQPTAGKEAAKDAAKPAADGATDAPAAAPAAPAAEGAGGDGGSAATKVPKG